MIRGRVGHVAIALLVCALYLQGALEPLERLWMDLCFRLLRSSVDAPVAVVAIDPRSLDRLSVWPWPRGYHATLLERLIQAGATRVAFDIDFSSHSIPEEDDAFAQALAAAGDRAILPVLQRWQPDTPARGVLMSAAPLPSLRTHASLASINIRPEADGLVRRYWPVDAASGGEVPSLALALHGGSWSRRDAFYLDFGLDTGAIPKLSYVDVLTGQFDPGAVRGRAVIVGATAVELGDQVAVPVRLNITGPILQALAFTCLHNGRTLHRLSPWIVVSITALLGWLAGRMLEQAPWRRGLLFLLALLASVLAISVAAQHFEATIADVSPTSMTMAGAYAMGLVRRIDSQSLHLVAQAARVRSTETRMRHVVENSFDAIVTVSKEGEIETFNQAAETLFGWAASEVAGKKIQELVPEGFCPRNVQGGRESSRSASRYEEVVGLRRDGTAFPLELTSTSFAVDGRLLRVGFLRDITQRKAQQKALEHQATHDALTDLPNRLLLQRRAEQCLEAACREARPSAFLILDLDRFKEVNDALGHHTGDRLLQAISRRLREPLRQNDTIARLGGDEFAIILPGSDLADAKAMAERLAKTLRRPFDLQGLKHHVDMSIGIALFPEHGKDPATLLQRGDIAMYQAKKLRNAVAVYDSDQDTSSVRHLALRGELHEAIERGHLVLHYQPKVSARTGRTEGVEALLRWQHPTHGLLPPAEFIPLAENTGLIRAITAWVLDAALRQCAEWERRGLPLSIAINCSARNLLEEDLPQVIAGKLGVYSVPAERLILELTESAIIEDPRRSLQVLNVLAGLGVRLSIDDFGTGYSSLEQLRRLPARELKIDKSFVMRMDQAEGDAVIVQSTIQLAHNLGLQAVAEGVESQAVWNQLRLFGCDLGQGFHLGRPLPAQALEERVAASPSRALSVSY